jgi:NADH dehydrogenase FAD-containing subunit
MWQWYIHPLHYDYLVIATGATYAFPIGYPHNPYTSLSISDGKQLYQQFYSDIQHSGRIVIIGSKSTAIELAAEINKRYGYKKNITIVTSQAW